MPDPMVMPMTKPMEDQNPSCRTSLRSVAAVGAACRAEAADEGGDISGQ
jgi:hypothetical protein